jgi:ADP-glucose pyrophosphorylase
VVGAGARVEGGASVVGSVLLPGASVAAGASVETSVLGTGAVVGENAMVRALSVVGVGVTVDPSARVDGDRVPA